MSNCGNCQGTILGTVRVVMDMQGGEYDLCARCLGPDATKTPRSPDLVAEVLRHIEEIRTTGSIVRPGSGNRTRGARDDDRPSAKGTTPGDTKARRGSARTRDGGPEHVPSK
jgi:hypothetical protein